MTESHVEASVLPLSVTCAPDERLAAALRAVVGRVGAVAGDGAQRQPFVETLQQVVTWAFDHADHIDGDLALEFMRDGERLQGEIRWQAAGAARVTPPASTSPEVDVTCEVDGAAVHCRISCRCA